MHPLRSRRLQPFAALTLTLLLSASPATADVSSTRDAMANAMARMMEAMGLLDDGDRGPAPGGMNPGAFGMPGMLPGMGQFMPGQTPWSTFGMDRMLQPMPGMSDMPNMPGWHATTLEGVWEGRAGGLLIVQGHRFRLYSEQGSYIDGLIQQRGDRIALYEPRSARARPYETAQHQGRLILRDPEGQVYLYRRLWLEDDGYGTAGRNR
jgi:hypothetical protein